ncbi:MAG: metallophosphoesterase [Actinomycetota bacterium]
MLLVSDVHGAADALARVAETADTLIVLGDLVNLIDYRTGEGIVSDVVGKDVVMQISELRARRRRREATAVWSSATAGREDDVEAAIGTLMEAQYVSIAKAIEGTTAFVIHGNADRPEMLERLLPPSARYVDAEVHDIDGWRVGFVGGGIPRIGTPGEVSSEEMRRKLDAIGPVDILCTHVAPDIRTLASDVIGHTRKGSPEILDYLLEHRPAFHYFGDIHQPIATTWKVGATTCVNAGYFRATGRGLFHG